MTAEQSLYGDLQERIADAESERDTSRGQRDAWLERAEWLARAQRFLRNWALVLIAIGVAAPVAYWLIGGWECQ